MRYCSSMVWVAGLSIAGCNSGATGPQPEGNGPIALFTVAASAPDQAITTAPWPNDLFRDESGHVRLSKLSGDVVDLTPHVIAELAERQDGFGVSSGAFFPLSDAIDATTVAGNLHLFDLGDGSELPVRIHVRERDIPPVIYARPANGTVLLEHKQYAYVVTRQVSGPTGALRPSSELSALLGSAATGRGASIYKPLADRLNAGLGGLKTANVAGATVFTTHSVTGLLVGLRTALEAAAAPRATVSRIYARTPTAADEGSLDELLGTPASNQPGFDNPGGIAHDKIGYVIQGTFDTVDFLTNNTDVTPGLGTPTPVDYIDEVNGVPMPKGVAHVPFTLVLPEAASFANLPVVLFQHGLNGDRTAVMAVANTLASAGYATLGIDIPFHGGRNRQAKDDKHNITGAAGADGWAEVGGAPYIDFFGVSGNPARNIPSFLPRASRSSFQQAASDVIQAARLVTVGDVSAVAVKEPRLATLSLHHDAVGYSGESFGSIIGAVVVAIEPKLGAAFLDVGGGGLVFPLMLGSPEFGPLISPFLDGAFGTLTGDGVDPQDSDFNYNLAQMLIEGGDALAMAPYIIQHPLSGAAPKHVLQPSAHWDETVPNIANEALARAIGTLPVNLSGGATVDLAQWPQAPVPANAPVSANVSGVTAAFIQFEPATHGMFSNRAGQRRYDLSNPMLFTKIAPVTVKNPTDRLHRIYLGFFSDYFAGRAPTVLDAQ